jgi:mRNA interferase MazF
LSATRSIGPGSIRPRAARWPSRIQASLGGQQSEVAVDQIRRISKKRIGDKIDSLSEVAAAELRHVITSMYGLLSE